jgi:5-methylcytosine-specific restriction endonuclease McrA
MVREWLKKLDRLDIDCVHHWEKLLHINFKNEDEYRKVDNLIFGVILFYSTKKELLENYPNIQEEIYEIIDTQLNNINKNKYEKNDSEFKNSDRIHLTEKEKDIVGRQCCNCGDSQNIEYHHVIPLIVGGKNILSNIYPVCYKCHSLVHFGKNKNINHAELVKIGIHKAKLKGKQIGRKAGETYETKKSIYAKKEIIKYSKTFNGSWTDKECIQYIGIARNSYYKYKNEIINDMKKEIIDSMQLEQLSNVI